MKLAVDKIFICHWDKLIDRKEKLVNTLKSLNIENEIVWVETHKADNLDITELKKEFVNIDHNIFSDYRPFKKSEISLALKHIDIFKEVYEKRYSNVLILEDDAIFAHNFIDEFNNYFNQLPIDYDLCFTGSCCNLHYHTTIPKVNVYRTDKGSRCTHAYLISYQGVCKIINDLNLLNDPIDFFLNSLVRIKNLNNFWFEPPLMFQDNNISTIQN